ncbi:MULTISPECIES: flagellar biosynthetic protein FliO [unclassified Corallococcus]|uniref:flagellar biosynthetic protein FliO n=1 Tax=Corallococcus TaxID=83461 RepID=UPI001CC06F8A|nr:MULTISPECIES: flagellar biosynthetic protein FliO [unclassified Corallococcus]MBZ4335760.1 flagellar biosynthetic protein FliO [Corallococcus sp. AS-1-12]MBZ4372654.1 flagellar biosynthetic protein FliO [Corallococcus sp. AS-1-6]
MAVLGLFPSRLLLGAALFFASPAVLAQAPAASSPDASVAAPAPEAASVQTPLAAPAPAVEGEAAARAKRHADELDRELGVPEAEGAEAQESLAWVVVRTVALLGAVLAAIYLTLNVGLRRLMGLQGVPVGKASVVSVMERIPLDQRRTLFVLKAADEYLLVGGGEGGVQLVSKLDRDAVERIRAARPPSSPVSLSPFLQKLLSRRTGGTTPPPGV